MRLTLDAAVLAEEPHLSTADDIGLGHEWMSPREKAIWNRRPSATSVPPRDLSIEKRSIGRQVQSVACLPA